MLPVNSEVYHYHFYRDGIEVRCKDGRTKHIVEMKAGKGLKLLGNGEEQYSWPIIYIYPEASAEIYRYFPSTAGTQCNYRILTPGEKSIFYREVFSNLLRI